jgi:ABC-type transport system involved in multi-copper enzyme maturation permease subunit
MPVFLRWLLRLAPTNPIAVRLVQNGSRRTRHLYIRSAYLAVLILVLLWTMITKGGGQLSFGELALTGASAFAFIAFLQIALICILAPVFMAGAIAQEANPQTWDILLTTPLSAVQIVLGNLFGRLFFIIALLFASLPLFALTQYYGGVPGRSIFASYLIAACAALLVGTIAIALSVSRLVGKRAVFAFYISVVSYLAITAGLDKFLIATGRGAGPGGLAGVTYMTAINPFQALLEPTNYPRAAPGTLAGSAAWFLETPVTTWCVGSLGLSLLLMIASTLTVRAGGIAGLGGLSGRGGIPWYRRILGLGGAGAEHRPPRPVWANPIAWREAAARNGTLGRIIARWTFVALGGLFGLGLIWAYHTGRFSHSDFRLALLATTMGEIAVISLVAINMAATAISREREDGTLDLLLTTPITPSSYLTGKLRGLIAYLLPMLAVPLGTLAVAGLYVLTGGLGREGGVEFIASAAAAKVTVPVVLPEAALVAPLVVVPFTAFCVMMGLQWSLKSRGTIGSVVGTVGVVGIISGVIGLCGWNAGPSKALLIGPAIAALSPVSALYAMVQPEDAMVSTIASGASTPAGGLASARVMLVVGGLLAALAYAAIVYGVHGYMVKNFDMTVRRLAGVR